MSQDSHITDLRPSEELRQWLANESKVNGLVDCKLMTSANSDASHEYCAREVLQLIRGGAKAQSYAEAMPAEYH